MEGWLGLPDAEAEAAGTASELALVATARGPTATPDPVPGLNLAAKRELVGDALASAAEGAEVPMMRLKQRGGFSMPLQRRTQIVDVLRRRPLEPIYQILSKPLEWSTSPSKFARDT